MTRQRTMTPEELRRHLAGSALERLLAHQIAAAGLPEPVREYAFAKSLDRRWRFDFAWLDQRLAVEVEGGVWSRGRHTRGAGFVKDAEKYNTATAMGWRVLRFTARDIEGAECRAVGMIREVLEAADAAERSDER